VPMKFVPKLAMEVRKRSNSKSSVAIGFVGMTARLRRVNNF